MEENNNQSTFEIYKSPLSKPFLYPKSASANGNSLFALGIVFIIFGICIITVPQGILWAIFFLVLGMIWLFLAVMIHIRKRCQIGDCPYCKKAIRMLCIEKQFKCPLCERPVIKTSTTIENAEPLNESSLTEPNISFEEMRDNFFKEWRLDLQCDNDQRKRLERARAETVYRLFDINPDNGTAHCYSSNYETNGKVYDVTYKHCTCPDYNKRFRPCKHIYAIYVNMGIIKEEENLSGVPDSIKEKVELLTPKSAVRFKNMLLEREFNAFGSFLLKNTTLNKPLLDVGLLVKTDETEKLLSILYTQEMTWSHRFMRMNWITNLNRMIPKKVL